MPVHKIVATTDIVEIWRSSDESAKISFTEAECAAKLVVEDQGNKTKIADQMKIDLQAGIDHRILRADMPQDDPAIISDPARPDFFWDGLDLVAREVIVESVTWDGERYVPVLKRARG